MIKGQKFEVRWIVVVVCAIVVYTVFAFWPLGLAVAQTAPYVVAASAVAVNSAAPLGSVYRHQRRTDETILTIKKRVDEVNVLFIATDRHGKFVRNLNQTDFSIFDDHKPVQSILNFRRETDLAHRTGLADGRQRLGAGSLRDLKRKRPPDFCST